MMNYKQIHKSVLENIDIFGIGINIRFNQKVQHKTKIGGLVTMVILFLMSYQLKLIIDSLTDTKNPTVLFEQRYTTSPERYDLTPDKFSFSFGLQDPKSLHYMDPAIYKVTLWQKKTKRVLDPSTGNYNIQFNSRIIKTEPCTKQHFQVKGAQDYFFKLTYSQMYCISLEETDVYIEGQFDAMQFSGLQLIVEQCTGNSCKTADQMSAILNNGKLAVYYIDYAVVPSDKENPFQPLGRQSFWVSGPQFSKILITSARNSYLQTDVGFLNPDIQEQKTLTWSFDREQTIPKNNNILYDFNFNFEKNMNSVYKRSYVKIDRAISQIGGAFNVLFAIGCILCKPLSQLELNLRLINNLFNFDEDKDDSDKKKKEKEISKSQDKSQQQDSIYHEGVKEEKSPHFDSSQNSEAAQVKHLLSMKLNQFKNSNSQTIQLTDKISEQNRSKQITQSKSTKSKNSDSKKQSCPKNQQQKELENFFKQETNKMKFKWFEYFINFFTFSDVCRSRKQILLHKGVDKLYNHIDIFYLINKLLELEKLKHLLLNEDQIKLFEFIPKPTLSMSNKKPQSISEKVGIQYENNKTLIEKTTDARDSFKKIVNKGETISKIDVRLLEFLDPKFKSYVQELDHNSISTDIMASKLANALETKKKIRIQTLEAEADDQILKIPFECLTNENNQLDTLDSAGRMMLNYQPRETNNYEIIRMEKR